MKKKKLKVILEVESILVELMTTEREWSSRLEAERIIHIVEGTSKEKIKMPWEHLAVRLPK